MKPFSDNIIFWDTEFTTLDPYKGELLSIGLVKLNGESLYVEIETDAELHPWVIENVIPYMTQEKISPEDAQKLIKEFVGEEKPFLVSYVSHYDAIYLFKMYNVQDSSKDIPFFWIPMDFASMLFAQGIDPEYYKIDKPENLAQELGIDYSGYNSHHALDDAKLLRDVYLKLLER